MSSSHDNDSPANARAPRCRLGHWILAVPVAVLAATGVANGQPTEVNWAAPTTGDWEFDPNWDLGVVPNNGPAGNFNATIGAFGAQYSVFVGSDITIDNFSLLSQAAEVRLASGNFSVLGSAELDDGVVVVDGGTVLGGIWAQNGGSFFFTTNDNNILSGVEVIGDLGVDPGGRVRLQNGTTVFGDTFVEPGAALTFEADFFVQDTTLSVDSGEVLIDSSSTLVVDTGGQVLLDGALINGGGIINGPGGVITAGTVTLGGRPNTIQVDVFDNRGGVVEVDAGESLQLIAPVAAINTGTVRTGAGSFLELGDNFEHIGAGELVGEGNVLTPLFVNQAAVRPGMSPGTLIIEGDFEQTQEGLLEIEVGGLAAGTAHDQLIVGGNAFLAGRLDVPIINGFTPAAGDTITFLTANQVNGEFDAVTSRELLNVVPETAVVVTYNPSSVDLQFAAVDTTNQFVSGNAVTEWSDAANWSNAPPTSVNETILSNPTGADRQVNVTANTGNVQVHILGIFGSGAGNTTTVNVTDNVTLAATVGVLVAPEGRLELGDAAGNVGVVAGAIVEVDADGVVAGNGTLRGDAILRGGSLLSPGFSIGSITVDGNYQQMAGATLEIEVEAAPDGTVSADLLTITGAAEFGGTLVVDATGVAAQTGGTVTVIDAGTIIDAQSIGAVTVFDSVETVNGDGIYFRPIYDTGAPPTSAATAAASLCGGSVCLSGVLIGDMNGDGFIDDIDVGEFALALTDPLAYFSANFVFGDQSGDLDANGRLDFDDIDDFASVVGVSESVVLAAIAALSVPEPTSALLALVLGGLAAVCRPRR